LKSKEVYLKDVMSTPVFSISPNISVRVAADQMVRRNIRRLPVVENGRLVGIVTDTDLISVSLDLNEVLYAVIGPQEEGISSEGLQGLCDKCGQLVEELFEVEGMLLCGSCADNFQ
jgi:signal-transduction protein with cAMP-binding, CBS, and nucleotidyltransferase domain